MLIQFGTDGQAANTPTPTRSTTSKSSCAKMSFEISVLVLRWFWFVRTKHRNPIKFFLSKKLRRKEGLGKRGARPASAISRPRCFKKRSSLACFRPPEVGRKKAYTVPVNVEERECLGPTATSNWQFPSDLLYPLEVASSVADMGALLFPWLLAGRQINSGNELAGVPISQLSRCSYRTGFPPWIRVAVRVEFSFGVSAINVHENQRQYLLVGLLFVAVVRSIRGYPFSSGESRTKDSRPMLSLLDAT